MPRATSQPCLQLMAAQHLAEALFGRPPDHAPCIASGSPQLACSAPQRPPAVAAWQASAATALPAARQWSAPSLRSSTGRPKRPATGRTRRSGPGASAWRRCGAGVPGARAGCMATPGRNRGWVSRRAPGRSGDGWAAASASGSWQHAGPSRGRCGTPCASPTDSAQSKHGLSAQRIQQRTPSLGTTLQADGKEHMQEHMQTDKKLVDFYYGVWKERAHPRARAWYQRLAEVRAPMPHFVEPCILGGGRALVDGRRVPGISARP